MTTSLSMYYLAGLGSRRLAYSQLANHMSLRSLAIWIAYRAMVFMDIVMQVERRRVAWLRVHDGKSHWVLQFNII